MKKYLSILFFCFLPIASSIAETNPRNLWYDRDYSEVFGLTLEGTALYSTAKSPKIIEINYTRGDDERLKFKQTKGFPYNSARINEDNSAITLKTGSKSVTLPQAPNVSTADMIGMWYFYKKDKYTEWSAIITKRENDYDYDYVYLDHRHKTYSVSTPGDYGVKYRIHNGWQIYENNELAFKITHFSGDRIEYVDISRDKFFEVRHSGQKNIAIPPGYALEQ
jgi:hypothetical protein